MHDRVNQNLIIKSTIGNNVIISGYASVFNVADQHNDIILESAFLPIKNTQNVKFLWQHDFSKPIGIIQSVLEDNYGLKIEAAINSKIEVGKEAIELIRQGAVDGLSVGFNIETSNYNSLNQRVITKAKLMEVSVVTFPANFHAKIYHIDNENIDNWPLENLKASILNLERLVTKFRKRR